MAEDLWSITWLQPEEAMAYWRERLPLTQDELLRIAEAHRIRAFTVAGVTSLQFIQAIWEAIDQAIAEGITMQEFAERVTAVAEKRGFTGLAPHHLDTVFLNNVSSAYMAGRYRQMRHPRTLEKRPIWVYDAVNDSRTRPSHAALDGIARRADDPFWRVYYPPNGHRCRCDVINLTPQEAERLGIQVGEGVPTDVAGPDPGWDLDPADAFDHWEPDLTGLPDPLRAAYEARQQKGR